MKVPLTAIALGVAAFVAYVQWDEYKKRQAEYADMQARAEAPATMWFVVRQVAVTDFKAGDKNVPAIYDREIKKPFVGDWRAEVHDANTQETVCDGGSTRYYAPSNVLPVAGVNLTWLVGKECDYKPGEYYVEINYILHPPGYPVKTYRAVSPIFKVTE